MFARKKFLRQDPQGINIGLLTNGICAEYLFGRHVQRSPRANGSKFGPEKDRVVKILILSLMLTLQRGQRDWTMQDRNQSVWSARSESEGSSPALYQDDRILEVSPSNSSKHMRRRRELTPYLSCSDSQQLADFSGSFFNIFHEYPDLPRLALKDFVYLNYVAELSKVEPDG